MNRVQIISLLVLLSLAGLSYAVISNTDLEYMGIIRVLNNDPKVIDGLKQLDISEVTVNTPSKSYTVFFDGDSIHLGPSTPLEPEYEINITYSEIMAIYARYYTNESISIDALPISDELKTKVLNIK